MNIITNLLIDFYKGRQYVVINCKHKYYVLISKNINELYVYWTIIQHEQLIGFVLQLSNYKDDICHFF